MSKLLNPENGLFTGINKTIDTLWVGLLWSVISLGAFVGGIFTQNDIIALAGMIISIVLVGPASCALYYATVKVTRRSRSYITKEFFRSFKDNFKIGAITSTVFGVFGYLMYVDIQYANVLIDEDNSFGNVMFVVFLAGTVFAVLALCWIFPLLSRFTVNFFGLLRNAMIISTRHLVRSILLLLLWGVSGVLIYVFYQYILYMIILAPLIPGLLALIRSFIIEPVMKKYITEPEGDPEETGIDEWYRE